jgi:hypothetical protein
MELVVVGEPGELDVEDGPAALPFDDHVITSSLSI